MRLEEVCHLSSIHPWQAINGDLDMTLQVVQCIKKNWKEIGKVCRDRTHIGRAPMMSPGQSKVRQSHY